MVIGVGDDKEVSVSLRHSRFICLWPVMPCHAWKSVGASCLL